MSINDRKLSKSIIFYSKLDNFNSKLFKIDQKFILIFNWNPILTSDFELDPILMMKLLESDFELSIIRFGSPNHLSLLFRH